MITTKKSVHQKFNGPLFLIGMPRSGTKLLRGLLNGNSRIAIPAYETEFFPYWVKSWDKFYDLSNIKNFIKFYNQILKAPYFIYCANEGELIDAHTWFNSCNDFSPAGVFEALIRHDTCSGFDTNIIWGDKSPSYINSIELIKTQFPNAKFIHIIRDVRDYCLSINYAWNKNMIRAAQRWTNSLQNARAISKLYPDDYIELRYEDLLEDPASKLSLLCEFVGVEFESSMLQLASPSEKIGDAKGANTVVKNNKNKYEKMLNPKVKYIIEKISGDVLESLDYPVINHDNTYKVPGYKMTIYKLMDGFNLLKITIKRIGVPGAIKYIYGALSVSSKR